MINPYVATPSYESYYLQKEAKEDENDTPSGANMDKLLSTIKCNRLIREQYYGCGYTCDIEPVPIRDIRLTYDYKKWKSKINGEFKLVVDSFLFSFARKLNKKNYGSFAEKKFFLSVISREISIAYPFKMISDLMTNFIENKVVKTVTRYSQKKIKYISNSKSKNYDCLTEIIQQKAIKTILKENNKLELINNISTAITDFHKKQFIEEKLIHYLNVHDIEVKPFIMAFLDLYRSHLAENYDHMISKFVEIFEDLEYDKECCMSLAFDGFFGEMIIHNRACILNSIVRDSINCSKELIRKSISSKRDEISKGNKQKEGWYKILYDDFKTIVSKSKKKLGENIVDCLKQNDTVIFEDNKVCICNEKSIERISHYAAKYSMKNLTLFIKQITHLDISK